MNVEYGQTDPWLADMASQTAGTPEAFMRARRLSICILLILVTFVIGSPQLRAEEPAQKLVRLGYVQPQSSSNVLGVTTIEFVAGHPRHGLRNYPTSR